MKNRKMPKGGRNLEKVLVVINYCSYVEFLEVALYNNNDYRDDYDGDFMREFFKL